MRIEPAVFIAWSSLAQVIDKDILEVLLIRTLARSRRDSNILIFVKWTAIDSE